MASLPSLFYLGSSQTHRMSQSIVFSILIFSQLSIFSSNGQSFDLTYHIEEELPLASKVGSIANDSEINRLLSATDFSSLRYRLLLYPNTDTGLFAISNTTGVLRTAARIDREILCHYETTCTLQLHVAAQTESGQQFYTFSVKVFVRDKNDNSPVFPLASVTVRIDEDASVLTSLPIASASDMDILNNTLQSYRLLTNSDNFGLKVSRNLDGSLVPQLYLKSELDREKQSSYLLTVLALDGGTPRRSGELTINVSVTDANDNAPMFSQQTYELVIDEITPVNSRVMTLKALDPDVGQNGRVIYRLGPRQSEEAYTTFRVIPDSGNIVTIRELTPFQGRSMRLVVEAIDHGSKPNTAQAQVNIHIRDSVNNVPIIRMTTSPSAAVFHVSEDAGPGFVVTHFVVADNDSGDNGMVNCHLEDDVFGLQRLKAKEYKVSVSSKLDRETTPYYEVTVTCEDGGQPSLTTSVKFSVILTDTNDNAPKFNKDVYRVNVTENAKNVVAVILRAEDKDLGQNGRVTYSLGNVTSLVYNYIQVNPTKGEVVTKKGLDRELFPRLDFQVVATDEGKKHLSSTARVIIDVSDQNDNMPRVPAGYTLNIMENSPPGTVVGRIHAIDPDLGLAGRVGYQLLSDNGATRLFNLTVTGVVTALRPFNREQRESYQINVLARDYDTSPRTNILHIRIRVTDDNDNPPVITFPRPGNKTAYVSVDIKPNTTVSRITATDEDVGENATLHFSMTLNRQDLFNVDPRSGRVYTRRRVDSDDRGSYRIPIYVRDMGPVPMTRSSELILIVTQGNGTAASSSLHRNSHIIIVAILIGITIIIAILVFFVVFRFVRKDRSRTTRHPKYSGGLPMAVKSRSASPQEDVSSEEGPWRRYDDAKRPPVGPGIRSADVTYDTHDDILMFKLKLADQYRELEPEDKFSGNGSLSRDGGDSNRTSVLSDDASVDVSRESRSTRLATFQVKSTPLQQSATSSKTGGCGTGSVVKIPEEVLSSCSRDLGGTDSGRGTSEDGSQGTSSFTDDSGCPTSPGHVTVRGGTTPRNQGNYSKPYSGSAFDRPPLLMTFQGTSSYDSPSHSATTLPSRRDYTTYGVPKDNSQETKIKETDILVHSPGTNNPGTVIDNHHKDDGRSSTFKKPKLSSESSLSNSNTISKSRDIDRGINSIKDQISALLRSKENSRKAANKDSQMCSTPKLLPSGDNSNMTNNTHSSFTPRGVQETGMPSVSMYATQNGGNAYNCSKPIFVGGGSSATDRSKTSHYSSISPLSGNNAMNKSGSNVSNFNIVTPSTSITNKLNSCPQLYKDSTNKGTSPIHSLYKTRPYNTPRESPLTLPSRSPIDMLNESLETQDDGNTTTTSGSYTIDHDDLNLDLPSNDVYV